MSIIGKKVIDRKTGDIGAVLSLSYKFVKDKFIIQLRIEFEYDGDTLIVNRDINNISFVGEAN